MLPRHTMGTREKKGPAPCRNVGRDYCGLHMGFLEWAVGSIVVCVVAFQVWLTTRVFRSNMFERRQKLLQAQLIWLVPIIGAGLVFSVLQEESKSDSQPPSHLKS